MILAESNYCVCMCVNLIETHSGYNMPWMLHNIVPFNILGGPVRHEEHHRSGKRYYQQFYTYLDDLFYPEQRSRKSA